jgi:hypothetical protein
MKDNAPRNETQISYHRRRLTSLKSVRSPWEDLWRSLGDYIEPSRIRLSLKPEGSRSRSKIVDSSGTFAYRTLKSGMHSGLTSPARPWFKLASFDDDLTEYGPVKEYLATVERRMREVYQGSNIYNAFHTGYGDLGQFGQSVGILVEHGENVVRMMQLTHGRFWIARDDEGRATTLYREFQWSVERVVGRFGYKNCSQTVRTAYDNGNYDDLVRVCHAIEPRMNRDPGKLDRRNKPFLSNYWEDETRSSEHKLLEESGFDENPIVAPPWEISEDENYAVSPGHVAIGDVKMLQKMQLRKMEAIDKKVRPPMTGPTSMMNNPASLLPGAITYADVQTSGGGFRPAMDVNLSIAELMNDMAETRQRIDRAWYADLFLMLSNMEGVQPRNDFEIAERKEEKLLALGPVLENVYAGQLEPVIDRTFNILNRRKQLPPPPPELENQPIKIEYISMLAQAQKAVATGSLERLSGYIGNLAAVKPDVLDKFDADQAVDEYAEMIGAPPSVITSDDKVAEIRSQRAQQQQAAQQAEAAASMAPAMKQGAEAAKVLSDTTNNPNGGDLLRALGLN